MSKCGKKACDTCHNRKIHCDVHCPAANGAGSVQVTKDYFAPLIGEPGRGGLLQAPGKLYVLVRGYND
jgi:hypothetical protein